MLITNVVVVYLNLFASNPCLKHQMTPCYNAGIIITHIYGTSITLRVHVLPLEIMIYDQCNVYLIKI